MICYTCFSELSPWEGDRCISCDPMCDIWWAPTNADLALKVLESESGPISIYDVCRGIGRETGHELNQSSIAVSLASDSRFCWAGRGLYGLYRHRLLPGPRNLAGVAKFHLYTAGAPVDISVLAFLMRFMGYRFGQPSLASALNRDPDVIRYGWSEYGIEQEEETARALNDLEIAPSMSAFHSMVGRWRRFMDEGVSEYEKRSSPG